MSVKAKVEDPYRQAGSDTPVLREGGFITPKQLKEAVANFTPKKGCQCGNGYRGQPHLCLKWHPGMLGYQAQQEFSAVVAKHVGHFGNADNPIVSVVVNADTLAYLRSLVPANFQVIAISNDALTLLQGLHDNDGKRFTFAPTPRDTYGDDLTVTTTPDPEWVKTFVAQHTEKKTAMPICCANPDPRIAKSGRPYCHSCKKYLDRVPPPQLPTNPAPKEVA